MFADLKLYLRERRQHHMRHTPTDNSPIFPPGLMSHLTTSQLASSCSSSSLASAASSTHDEAGPSSSSPPPKYTRYQSAYEEHSPRQYQEPTSKAALIAQTTAALEEFEENVLIRQRDTFRARMSIEAMAAAQASGGADSEQVASARQLLEQSVRQEEETDNIHRRVLQSLLRKNGAWPPMNL